MDYLKETNTYTQEEFDQAQTDRKLPAALLRKIKRRLWSVITCYQENPVGFTLLAYDDSYRFSSKLSSIASTTGSEEKKQEVATQAIFPISNSSGKPNFFHSDEELIDEDPDVPSSFPLAKK